MKIRIKVIEYNNGKKEYVCQYRTFEERRHALFFIVLGVILVIITPEAMFKIIGASSCFLFYVGMCIFWTPFQRRKGSSIRFEGNDNSSYEYEDAIFTHLHDAKKFIDDELKNIADKDFSTFQGKVKKTEYVKHP